MSKVSKYFNLKRLAEEWAGYFGLTKGQSLGLFVLLVSCLILFAASLSFERLWYPPGELEMYSQSELDSLFAPKAEIAISTEASPRLNLNKATASDLQAVKGIGPVAAGAIVDYRRSLGGFVDTLQLAEVRGLRPKARRALLAQAFIAPDFVPQPVYLDSYGCDELLRHPYFSPELCLYLERIGPIENLRQWWELPILTDSLKEKIYPYVALAKESPE